MIKMQKKILWRFFLLALLISLLPTDFLCAATIPVPVLKWRNGGFRYIQYNEAKSTSPATLDVNGDGCKDIIWANLKVFAFDGKNGSKLWEFYAGSDRSNPNLNVSTSTLCSIVVADINADGKKEIVTAHGNGSLCAYRADGYFLPGFPTKPAGRTDPICSLSVYDLDNNGDMEIIIGWGYANKLNCCVIEHNGQVRSGFPQLVSSPNANALGIFNANIAVGDINGDNHGEIVAPSDTGKTGFYYDDGNAFPVNATFGSKNRWHLVVNYEDYASEKAGYAANGQFYMGTDNPATIADMDGDRQYEIVIAAAVFSNPPDGNYQNLYVSPFIYNCDRTRFKKNGFNWEGSLPKTGAPLSNEWQVIALKKANPVVVDLDHDGQKEILSSSYDGKLHCYWLDRTEHGSWPFSVLEPGDGVIRFSSEPAVVDLNNDGELEVIFTTWTQYYSNKGGHLYILNAAGGLLRKLELPYGDNGDVGEKNFDGGLACPTIDDVDGDGEPEIIVAEAYAGLIVYDLPGAHRGAAPWPTSRLNYQRTGFVDYTAAMENLIGTWDGQGVYYLDFISGAWVELATPAALITSGDLDGDGIDDLIGIWPSQDGIWVRYSSSGGLVKLSSTAHNISSGDMNGDGRVDLVATWDGQGVYYRNSLNGAWVKLATPADQVTAGDLDGDGKDDLIGIWPGQGGVWAKYSQSGSWAKLSTTAIDIACGDMNGDGRDDLLATWDGQGVYYRNSINGAWVKLATPATLVTAGDLDGDGTDDAIGIWPSQSGVWVKYSKTGAWARLSSTAIDIAVGKMRATGSTLMGNNNSTSSMAASLMDDSRDKSDLSASGPGGLNFVCSAAENLLPLEQSVEPMRRVPGPGEAGFCFTEQKNLEPWENDKPKDTVNVKKK